MRLFPLIVCSIAAVVLAGCGEDGNPAKPPGITYTVLTQTGGTMLDWSPDGERIGFADSGVWTIPSAGSEATRLASGGEPSWSPDGSMIAYHWMYPGFGQCRVRVMTDSGTSDTLLTWGAHPDWSPLGDLIAFDRYTDPEWGGEGIRLIPPAGGRIVLVLDWGQHADWSPDAGHIAFCTHECRKLGIWVVPSSGGEPVQLTTGYDWSPRWSPDGRWIAYFTYFDWQMYVIRVEGGAPIHVTGGPETKAWPAWSPDGERIAFSSYIDGHWEIWIASDLPF